MMTPAGIVEILGLRPHPEGGWYAETYRDPLPEGGRAHSSAIYYLLEGHQESRWHRVDATEVWHYHAGAALELRLSPDGHAQQVRILGSMLEADQRPQIVVPRGWWQSARSRGRWTLVGCTVAPGFEFAGFEMAPPGWSPAPAAR